MSSFDDEHSEWDALAVGWALSALDPADEERFAAHLTGCDRCTATVRESLYTVSDLAYGMPAEEPPPSLKASLMAAVRAEPRRTADAAAAVAPVAEPQPVGDDAQWPMSAPHPGAPGYSVDWFARPGRTDEDPAEPPFGEPPRPGDRLLGGPPRPGDPRAGGPVAGDRFLGEPPRSGDRAFGEPPRPGDHGFGEPPRLGDPRAGEPVAGDRLLGEPPVAGDRAFGAPSWSAGRPAGEPRLGDPPRGRHAVPDGDDGTVVALEPRRRSRGRRLPVVAAAAAVIALVAGLAGWNVQLRNDRDSLQQVVAQREAAISQLTANGPARIAALTGDGKPSAPRRATLVVRGDRVEVLIEGLPPSAGNQRYWLWTLRCDAPTPTDLKPIRGFQVTQQDFSVRDIGSDPGLASATCFAISSEVGTATPTEPRVVVAVGQPG